MDHTYEALQVTENNGKFDRRIVTLNTRDLPINDILIKVNYSSVNYKDALSASGNRGVTRIFPHVPGIDAAGEVICSSAIQFQPGNEVLVTGFDLGMNTWGGFSGFISVPKEWVLPLPDGLTQKEAMRMGTAGLTAGLSVYELIQAGIRPEHGQIAISGATGGVGSIASLILKRLGYTVVAITDKSNHSFLKDTLGVDDVLDRNEFADSNLAKPISAARFAAGIDTVSGDVLSGMIKSMQSEGVVVCCGMVASTGLNTSIFPFILRGVRLIGIDSVQVPLTKRQMVWNKLAGEWKPDKLAQITREIGLHALPEELDRLLAGEAKGRVLLKL